MLLDTSILVELLRGNMEIKDKVDEREKREESLRTSSICAFELYYGAYASSKVKENLKLIKDVLKSLELKSYDEKAADFSGTILADLKREGKMVDLRDLFISATAMSLGDKIATRNIRHFDRVKGLRIELW